MTGFAVRSLSLSLAVGLSLASACGGSASEPKPTGLVSKPSPSPPAPRLAELLGDVEAIQRLPFRARLLRLGEAWVALGDEPLVASDDSPPDDDFTLPVVEDRGARVRVILTEDSARLAVWVMRKDLGDALARTQRLAPGVEGMAGAPLEILRRAGDRRLVRIVDPEVRVQGLVASAEIDQVWRGSDTGARELTTNIVVSPGTQVLRAADPGSEIIARIDLSVPARSDDLDRIRAARSEAAVRALVEVTIDRPYFRVRGFVAAGKVSLAPGSVGASSGWGALGYGSSHADRIALAAGTCLYDAIDGEVVGIETEAQTRYGSLDESRQWSSVMVATLWDIAEVYVRQVGYRDGKPTWQLCPFKR